MYRLITTHNLNIYPKFNILALANFIFFESFLKLFLIVGFFPDSYS